MVLHVRERDSLVWHQYAQSYGRPKDPPEKRLLVAVLTDAVTRFAKGVRAGRGEDQRMRELATWFSSHDAKWPFSFENVCEQLEVDPESIRTFLDSLSRERLKEPAG